MHDLAGADIVFSQPACAATCTRVDGEELNRTNSSTGWAEGQATTSPEQQSIIWNGLPGLKALVKGACCFGQRFEGGARRCRLGFWLGLGHCLDLFDFVPQMPEEDADVELGGGALEDRVGLGVGMVQSIPQLDFQGGAGDLRTHEHRLVYIIKTEHTVAYTVLGARLHHAIARRHHPIAGAQAALPRRGMCVVDVESDYFGGSRFVLIQHQWSGKFGARVGHHGFRVAEEERHGLREVDGVEPHDRVGLGSVLARQIVASDFELHVETPTRHWLQCLRYWC